MKLSTIPSGLASNLGTNQIAGFGGFRPPARELEKK